MEPKDAGSAGMGSGSSMSSLDAVAGPHDDDDAHVDALAAADTDDRGEGVLDGGVPVRVGVAGAGDRAPLTQTSSLGN